jgi:hypothetical protein
MINAVKRAGWQMTGEGNQMIPYKKKQQDENRYKDSDYFIQAFSIHGINPASETIRFPGSVRIPQASLQHKLACVFPHYAYNIIIRLIRKVFYPVLFFKTDII